MLFRWSSCLPINQKTKIVEWMGFQGILCTLALPFILFFCQGLSLFYTQTCSVIFSCLPVNLTFYSMNRPPFVLPCILHIAAQTQKASLASIIVIGGWWAGSSGTYWRTFNTLHFYSVMFPACIHLISYSSYSNLHKFILQKLITFMFTSFALTLVPITNLTRFWFSFTSRVSPLFT